MANNKIKTTLRYLGRNKLFTTLNIIGLSIGISACWLVFSIVHYELSFDKKIPDAENIYQIVSNSEFEGEKNSFAGIPLGMPPLLTEYAPKDILVVPIYNQYFERIAVTQSEKEDIYFDEQENIVGTRLSYFEMIPYQWLAGDPKTTFSDPYHVVLTHSRAQVYFPNLSVDEVMGKTLRMDTVLYTVSGVIQDLNYPNSFKAQVFLPISEKEWSNHNWRGMNSNHTLYIRSSNRASVKHMLDLARTEYKKIAAKYHEEMGIKFDFGTALLSEKHFNKNTDTEGMSTEKKVIYGLMLIGGFLLLLACINYINLSTAQVPQRAKEIGIRKTLGARPFYLTFSFLVETFVITSFALLLSWPLVNLFRKIYPEFLPKGIENFDNSLFITVFLMGLVIFISLLAGLYPAFLINKVRSIETLKGKVETKVRGTRLTLRKSLIVFQFVIAQFFIVSALIIGQQLDFTIKTDLGFQHDAVLTINLPYKSYQNADVNPFLYKKSIEKYPEIEGIALGHQPLNNNHWGDIYYFNTDTGRVQLSTPYKYIDKDYLDVYNIKLIAGKNIQQTDTMRDILINETALKVIGLSNPDEAIGKLLLRHDNTSFPIVGVFRDFHQKTLHSNIEPLVLGNSNKSSALQAFNIKLSKDPKKWTNSIAILEKEWKKLYPQAPFEYKFTDERLESLYETEHRTAKLIHLATVVTIFISCLGLFGLATLTAFQRTKEIGIRKALGSSITGIITLLSKDFVKLIIVAVIIASPIAWWAMTKWLEDFAYRIDIQWWMFAFAGLLAISVALITVGYQSVRAALTNPVDSLRDE